MALLRRRGRLPRFPLSRPRTLWGNRGTRLARGIFGIDPIEATTQATKKASSGKRPSSRNCRRIFAASRMLHARQSS